MDGRSGAPCEQFHPSNTTFQSAAITEDRMGNPRCVGRGDPGVLPRLAGMGIPDLRHRAAAAPEGVRAIGAAARLMVAVAAVAAIGVQGMAADAGTAPLACGRR